MTDKICIDNREIRDFATKAHEGQTRWNGDPYITHCIRVAEAVKHFGSEYEAAALLHDVLEDTKETEETLQKAGISSFIINIVKELTHMDEETYADYIERVSYNEYACRIKLADLEDNLHDIDRMTPRAEKYNLSHLFLKQFY